MKKTKKIAALACAGIVACGIAALPISAATTNTGDVTVQYIAGTVNTDPDGNGNRLVALPADVTFAKGSTPTVNDYNISLISKDGTNFPAGLNVEVRAKSNQNLELRSTTVAGVVGNYTAAWGTNQFNTTTNAQDTNGALAVTFNTANFNNAVDVNTLLQTGTLDLPQAEMDKLELTKKGAIFKDVITFTINDNTV